MTTSIIINIHLILSAIWRQRYLITLPAIVLPIIAIMACFISPRAWQAHTTILVQESAKMNPFLEDLSVSTDLENRMTTLDTLLHSRHMLINVGKDLKLINEQSTDFEKDQLVKELSLALKVKLIGKDLVKLVYNTDSPENIVDVLLVVRERFLEKLLAPELSAIDASESFLTTQLTLKTADLQASEFKLANFKQLNAEHLPRLYSANSNRFSQLSMLLEQKKIELSGAIAAKRSIRTRLAQVDPVMSEIEQSIVTTKSELAILRSRYTDRHSKVQISLRKLSQLEDERISQSKASYKITEVDLNRLWEIANRMQDGEVENSQNLLLVSQLQELQFADSHVEKIKEEINSITRQTHKLKTSLSGTGEMERQLLTLERDLKVKRGLYSDLLYRYEKAKITGALGKFEQPERIKIIDEPYQPSSPTNFPLSIFLIAGIIGGICLGGGLALFAELADTSIRAKYQLELITSAPVITRIPRIGNKPFENIKNSGEKL
ncbi:GumC family protein [Colwellia psychrerythraea]|uniref:Lipopolysaccharide biosynthesis protein n=1 Tax=Colwellia psychrerythraea TaxID=28229 RepID=A0A099K8F6_COLPS|nr:Wzz/FepE/Etk N-terminal domain-containing protein [Colwellia psychrerythraea]KGJ86560.1 lipopolysaccharide biosynthesis protein [Colwellia psychrerythraea]